VSEPKGRGTLSAREEVLARIRTALGPDRDAAPEPETPHVPPPARPAYRTEGDLSVASLLDLLAERLADYRASVRRTTPDGLAAEVAAALAARGARRVVVAPGLPVALPPDLEAVADTGLSGEDVDAGLAPQDADAGLAPQDADAGLSPQDLDAVDGVITGAAVAIAETGTIVLDGSPDQGRRAITLVPDYHLCVVRAEQVVHLVPEAVARLADAVPRPLTWISGPSATSDIELSRVEGVHGPRTLEVILVGPGRPGPAHS
jgi:L-lactate dehydrogenase complex protein LldG